MTEQERIVRAILESGQVEKGTMSFLRSLIGRYNGRITKLSAKERSERGRNAARARWNKYEKTSKSTSESRVVDSNNDYISSSICVD